MDTCFLKDDAECLILPCGCLICGKNCLDYFNNLFTVLDDGKSNAKEISKICVCGHKFDIPELIDLSLNIEQKYNFSEPKEKMIKLMSRLFQVCMYCLKEPINGNKSFIVKTFKDDRISNLMNKQKFKFFHYLCDECSKNKSNDCQICKSHHMCIV